MCLYAPNLISDFMCLYAPHLISDFVCLHATSGGSSVPEVQRIATCIEVHFVAEEVVMQHVAFKDILLLISHNFCTCD